MTIKLTEMQKSALIEAGNIGSGHAAIALSQLMGKKIMIAIPSVDIITFSEISIKIFDTKDEVFLVRYDVLGDIKGVMIFILKKSDAVNLCEVVMEQKKGSIKKLKDMEISALCEIGNILSSSYLNAIGVMSGMSLVISTPKSEIGLAKNIMEMMNSLDIKIDAGTDTFCIRTEFMQMETRIEGYLLFASIGDSVEKLLKRLGV